MSDDVVKSPFLANLHAAMQILNFSSTPSSQNVDTPPTEAPSLTTSSQPLQQSSEVVLRVLLNVANQSVSTPSTHALPYMHSCNDRPIGSSSDKIFIYVFRRWHHFTTHSQLPRVILIDVKWIETPCLHQAAMHTAILTILTIQMLGWPELN
jgi:hypothetical protein